MNRKLQFAGSLVILLVPALLLITKKIGVPEESVGTQTIAQKVRNTISDSETSSARGRDKTKLDARPGIVQEDDPQISNISNELKQLEESRFTFCREYGDDEKTTYQFILKKPSADDREQMEALIADTKGSSVDFYDGILSWKERFRREYFFEDEFDQYIVSIRFNKKSGNGDYDIIGVPKGELSFREGNAPTPTRMIYFVRHPISFKFDSNWRFSRILKYGEEGKPN